MFVHVCVCVSPLSLLGNSWVKNPSIVARQRLDRNVTALTNIMRYYVYITCPHNCFVVCADRVISKESRRLVFPRNSRYV
jgi:hypothetical protein